MIEEVSRNEMLSTIHYMTEHFPYRLAGSPCEAAASRYVTERLKQYGLEVENKEFYTYNSDPMYSKVTVLEPEMEIDSLPCAHIRATKPEGEIFELIYVGNGDYAAYKDIDVTGKMVLVEVSYAPPVPEKARIAYEMGAAGIMCMNWGNDEEVICRRGLKGMWGNPTEANFHCIPEIVGVGVTRGKKRMRPPLSQQKEFRQIKNAVIKEAEHIRMNRFSFEDEEMQDDGEQISTYDMSYECQYLQSVANDESFPLEERDKAAEQLEQLAEDGDAYAQYIIGTAYRDGGLLIPDMVKVQKLLKRAAEQGLGAAQYALGKLYLSDDADVHNSAKGIYWLKRSADNGNDYAAYRLGKEYLSGKNVSKDTSAAAEYLRQAANDGNAYAQYLLGKLTLMGEGVPKDPDTAYEWFVAARDNGHAYAEFFMKRMGRQEDLPPPNILLSATRLLYHMGNIFRDSAPAPVATGVQIDRKRLAQMRQKRIALGHKPDDHELEQQQGFSMKFHM